MEDGTGRDISRAVCDLFFSAEFQGRFVDTAMDLGLSPPMLKALIELEPGDGQPMRQLAEEWGCDASFVTVVVDGLESNGYARRRVADHDRRVRTVELTGEGVEAREAALDAVYGPFAGADVLTPDERSTLAALLRKLADAQAVHDEELLADRGGRQWGPRAGPRPGHRARAQGPRWARARERILREADPQGEGWRAHVEAHREELLRLRDELRSVRDEVKAQARRPLDEVRAIREDAVAEAKLAKADLQAQLKGRNRRT